MTLSIISAMTSKRVIGKNGELPWNIPEDVQLFKNITRKQTVIMGKTTWLSIPEKFRPLPGRTNIIVSSTMAPQKDAIVCKSIDQALMEAKRVGPDAFCIGGAQIYAEMLPLADVLHISWVKKDYEGDAYFPEIDFSQWNNVETKEFQDFTYKKYLRIKR